MLVSMKANLRRWRNERLSVVLLWKLATFSSPGSHANTSLTATSPLPFPQLTVNISDIQRHFFFANWESHRPTLYLMYLVVFKGLTNYSKIPVGKTNRQPIPLLTLSCRTLNHTVRCCFSHSDCRITMQCNPKTGSLPRKITGL